MTNLPDRPLKVLTTFRQVTKENWPGQVPIELFYADDESELVAKIPGIDVLSSLIFTKEMGAAADQLKLIQSPAAGIDKIDLEAVPEGCIVANVCAASVIMTQKSRRMG